ncbi:lachesin [Anopheles darlingi]|uniref:Lachesin n=1 Tax=Anopheles darlingi TaxID=43151 RepID=W5JWV8_ANODA|nr:lachesin [Anopheles darlingi]
MAKITKRDGENQNSIEITEKHISIAASETRTLTLKALEGMLQSETEHRAEDRGSAKRREGMRGTGERTLHRTCEIRQPKQAPAEELNQSKSRGIEALRRQRQQTNDDGGGSGGGHVPAAAHRSPQAPTQNSAGYDEAALATATATDRPVPIGTGMLDAGRGRRRDATFTCVVNNLGGYRVAWIKADAKAILAIHEHVITNNGRLSVTHNDYNTWTLVIRNVKMEDRGVYMCQVNTDPMKMQVRVSLASPVTIQQTNPPPCSLTRRLLSVHADTLTSLAAYCQTAFLEVVIPPDIIYEETSGDMMVPEGGSAKLICKARGYPKPKIVWRREDGREIIARNGTHGKMKATIVEGEILSLTKVTRSEMGAYMCIASNGVPPSVSKRLKLQVHFHPLIQVPNQLVGAPLNTDVTLICNVEASPKAINYWQRENGEMIISNERYLMNENESSMYAVQMTLVIRKLHKADMGGYKCISKNSIGDAEGTIRLYEMELQKKSKSALRLNGVEDTSGNDEINATPNVDQLEETNKIHKNGRLYKGLQTGDNDLITSSTNSAIRPHPAPLQAATTSSCWCFVLLLLFALATTSVRFQCAITLVSLPARIQTSHHRIAGPPDRQRSQPQPSEPPPEPARWMDSELPPDRRRRRCQLSPHQVLS